MNSIAFVFTSAPHGTALGREGLDALIATSIIIDNIGVFFIGDGVFQLLDGQKPQKILARDYISTFKVLPLYGIKIFWVCASSMQSRGITEVTPTVLDIKIINSDVLRDKLNTYNVVLNF